ncbi:hypothetical protein ENSA5_44410 [Enhygromyxa salina]|uniref:Uncharacterized protein n=1 Tax=Enhygromyxa salina TaxID=215803 RepID=A0A2S9XJX3_9BACT|nr:hypothetical protein [Enhygromyxa salina]PRP93174.1 hypothetical protein ENSA5_44410 [Enhygromyxa salina]
MSSDHDGGVGEAPTADPGEGAIAFVDAATRVSRPSAFDGWYYKIEDTIGQGTIGMGVCFIVFMVILLAAMWFSPI